MIKKVKFPNNIIYAVLILLLMGAVTLFTALVTADKGTAYSEIQLQLWGSLRFIIVAFVLLAIGYLYALFKK